MTSLTRIWEHVERLMTSLITRREEYSNDTSSIYQRLQHGEIRVVTVAPGKWNDRLECTLKIVSLDDYPSYEALSYVWGDANIQKKPILLQEHTFHVTRSLESALRYLRHEDSQRTIWIDALCINQNDDVEKSVQVKLMQFIYARTSHLVIWVGEASEDSDLGMQTIRQVGEELKEGSHWDVDLANVSLIKNLPQDPATFDPKPWVAASRLFRREWFERVWVIQEVCMPDAQMTFVCGRESVLWNFVSRVFHAVQGYRWGLERTIALFQAGYEYTNMDTPVNLVREVWTVKPPGRKCGNPRDKVFAILGICKDLSNGDITVDYSSSVARVYSDVSKFIVMRDRSLKLLSACQSYGSAIAELPSWAPDWSIDARFRPTKSISSWEGDDQSEMGRSLRYMFNASGSFSARVKFSNDLRAMSAQGLAVGKILVLGTHIENDGDTIETPATEERMFSLFKTWWPLAKTQTPESTPSGERRLDAFWRTIITDMNNFCQKATHNDEGAQFRRWMASWDPTAFGPEDLADGERVQDIIPFIASFRQATANRRFFVTEEGHMGLGPRLTTPGDLVYILLGSQVPFVLRAVGDSYILVGECYCHGVMEGEVVRGLDEEKFDLQDFALR